MGTGKYSVEEKVAITKRVINGEIGVNEASRETGIHRGDIQKWVSAYTQHGIAGIDRQRISYTGEFRQTAVEDMRRNGLSYRETAAKYNVPDHKIVAKWERTYLEEGVEGLYIERRGRSCKDGGAKPSKPAKQEDLIAENQRLRAEVDYLKKLNALVQEREHRERNPR